jgi:hypothetical protein
VDRASVSSEATELAKLAGDMAARAYQERKLCPHWEAAFPGFLAKVRAATPGVLIEALGLVDFLPIEDRKPYMEPLREVVMAEVRQKQTDRVASAGNFLACVGIGLATIQAILASLPYVLRR